MPIFFNNSKPIQAAMWLSTQTLVKWFHVAWYSPQLGPQNSGLNNVSVTCSAWSYYCSWFTDKQASKTEFMLRTTVIGASYLVSSARPRSSRAHPKSTHVAAGC